jgi:indole-3-glycerol phosphate synthase
MSKLDELVGAAREGVERRKAQVPAAELRDAVGTLSGSRPFSEALVRPGLSVIAEFKRRSPSGGEIAPGATVANVVAAYERGGAAALSVLTDERNFGGSLDDLRAARAACGLPILRKDFIVDPYQLYEAVVNGADAVLLIVAALDAGPLARLRAAAAGLGLATLVEVHDVDELARAVDAGADVVGVNNRNLRTLAVDVTASETIAARLPTGVTAVSESGLKTAGDLRRLREAGYHAFLIGERFMATPDPGEALRALIAEAEAAPLAAPSPRSEGTA